MNTQLIDNHQSMNPAVLFVIFGILVLLALLAGRKQSNPTVEREARLPNPPTPEPKKPEAAAPPAKLETPAVREAPTSDIPAFLTRQAPKPATFREDLVVERESKTDWRQRMAQTVKRIDERAVITPSAEDWREAVETAVNGLTDADRMAIRQAQSSGQVRSQLRFLAGSVEEATDFRSFYYYGQDVNWMDRGFFQDVQSIVGKDERILSVAPTRATMTRDEPIRRDEPRGPTEPKPTDEQWRAAVEKAVDELSVEEREKIKGDTLWSNNQEALNKVFDRVWDWTGWKPSWYYGIKWKDPMIDLIQEFLHEEVGPIARPEPTTIPAPPVEAELDKAAVWDWYRGISRIDAGVLRKETAKPEDERAVKGQVIPALRSFRESVLAKGWITEADDLALLNSLAPIIHPAVPAETGEQETEPEA